MLADGIRTFPLGCFSDEPAEAEMEVHLMTRRKGMMMMIMMIMKTVKTVMDWSSSGMWTGRSVRL